METRLDAFHQSSILVLIVPCGMETTFLERQVDITDCINCTLRNGNSKPAYWRACVVKVLIVPCGMETHIALLDV